MGSYNSNQSQDDSKLSLDEYVRQLKDYKEKAYRVFTMSGSGFEYVLSALQYAIDVAQGKNVVNEEHDFVSKKDDDSNAAPLTFHKKFSQIINKKDDFEKSNNFAVEKKQGPRT